MWLILKQVWFLELLNKVKQHCYKANLQNWFLGNNFYELYGKNSSLQTALWLKWFYCREQFARPNFLGHSIKPKAVMVSNCHVQAAKNDDFCMWIENKRKSPKWLCLGNLRQEEMSGPWVPGCSPRFISLIRTKNFTFCSPAWTTSSAPCKPHDKVTWYARTWLVERKVEKVTWKIQKIKNWCKQWAGRKINNKITD